MKAIRNLLLLLLAIISQGVWAQNTPSGSGFQNDPYIIGVGEWTITLPYTSGMLWGSDCSAIGCYTIFQIVPSIDGELVIESQANQSIQYALFDESKSCLSYSSSMSQFNFDAALEAGKTYYVGMRVMGGRVTEGLFIVNIYCTNHQNTEVIPGTATCTQGGTIEYLLCHDCGGRFTNDGEFTRLNDWDINVNGLGHLLENDVCTRCGEEVGISVGQKVISIPAGDFQETAYQFTATKDGIIEVSIDTDAAVSDVLIMEWDEYLRNGSGPACAPRKSARSGEQDDLLVWRYTVRPGNNYAIVFITFADEETSATVNVGYYGINISDENVDLATVLSENPDVKEFVFGWETNQINVCTITRDVTLNLRDLYSPSFSGQLKVDNGANVVINGGGNLDFSNVSDDAFCFVVEDGHLTCSSFSNIYGGYHGVLVKKGSFTAQGTRIRANEAVVARKALGSTNDVAINIVEGSEIWGSKVAIYMDVNGHLTIDNPGTYQGIQGDTQSIVAKAGTIDLSNIERYGIRNNGPVGSDEDRPEPVMHGRIPYLYGVPAVALQVGTDEEGFTGTTVLRMRNVQFDCNAYEDEPDFQLVLLTGSETHPTRYQMANVQGKGQIVVENAEYVELVEPVVVYDGDNTNVSFVSGTAQETVLKYTATDSRVLEVSAETDATIVSCSIIPWAEWDGEPEDDDNGDAQYARRKVSARVGAAPTGKTVAMAEVTEGNTYAILFTTTAATNSAATITLSYLDVNIPSEENGYMLAEGKNILTLESYYGYNRGLYTFVPEKTGIVTLTSDDTSYLEVWDDDEYDKWTNDDGTILKCVLQEGVVYTVYVETDADVTTAMLTITVEDFDGTLVLDDTKDLAENLGEWRNIDTFTVPEGVTYMRNATTSKWGTVVLPYELQSNDKVAYYELTAADIPTGNLEFTKVETVEPNTPTVFRIISGNQYDASVDGPVTVELPEDLGGFDLYVKTKVDGWFMDGWYYQAVIDTQHDDYFMDSEGHLDPDAAGIMYISGDKFWHATGTVTMKPYRAIFEAYGVDWSAAPAKAMTISFKDDDDVVTTIESVMEENGEFADVEAVYSIDGQRKSGIQRGVNIIRTADGKTRKFIKK